MAGLDERQHFEQTAAATQWAEPVHQDSLYIETPEQVELHFAVAGMGSRFVAVLLDYLILGSVGTVLLIVFVLFAAGMQGAMHSQGDKWFIAGIIVLVFLMLWGYFALFEALWRGQTPGKRVMKLRVIKDSGRQITFFESLARNLIRQIDWLPSLYLVGAIAMLCNKANKRLGDLAAGTIVVHERTDEQPLLFQAANRFLPDREMSATPWQVAATQPLFPADAVARLGPQDLIVIETFFARMLDLPLETRAALAYRITSQMCAKMGVAAPEGNPERAMEAMAFQMRRG